MRRHFLALALLTLPVAAGYFHTLDAAWHFDDVPNIVDNPNIRSLEAATVYFRHDSFKRPVAYFTFAINYALGGTDPRGYHVGNLTIHLWMGWVLYGFLWSLLGTPGAASVGSANRWYVALTAAVLWSAHPVQTQAVTYIVQRMASLASLWYVLALWLYLTARQSGGVGRWAAGLGAATAALLAFATKENTATLPAFVILIEFLFVRDGRRPGWDDLLWILPLLVLPVLLGLLYMGPDPVGRFGVPYAHRPFTPWERQMTEFRVIFLYLGLMILPLPRFLTFDYDFPISHGLMDPPQTLLCMLGLVALLGIAIVALRRRRVLAFCILWFLGNLAMESSFLGLEMVFEHRLYLPSIAVTLAFASLLYRSSEEPRGGMREALVVVLAGLLTLGTFVRNNVWCTIPQMLQDNLLKSPKKARVHNAVGSYLFNLGMRGPEVENAFLQALELRAGYAVARMNLAHLYVETGRAQEALRHLDLAAEEKPSEPGIYFLRGKALLDLGRPKKALPELERASSMRPWDAAVYVEAARAQHLLGVHHLERDLLQLALDVAPGHAGATARMGVYRAEEGDVDGGLRLVGLARSVAQFDREGWLATAEILRRAGRSQEAVEILEQGTRKAIPPRALWLAAAEIYERDLRRPEDAARCRARSNEPGGR